MIKTSSKLSCKFKNNEGQTRSLNIDKPVEDLTPEKISGFMDRLIERNMFSLKAFDMEIPVTSMKAASITRKEVETIDVQATR